MLGRHFKLGDHVEIINPEFVVRVGYPTSLEAACAYVETNMTEAIKELLRQTGLYHALGDSICIEIGFHTCGDWPPSGGLYWQGYHSIVRGLAKMHLTNTSHGGNERSIHTIRHATCVGKTMRVVAKKTCKTGTYDQPYSYQDHNGEWESYSGGLIKCKTHTLLELSAVLEVQELISESPKSKFGSGCWIESCNVVKITTR